MFGIGRIVELLKRQGIIQDLPTGLGDYLRIAGPVDVQMLDTKVDLLMDHLDVELEHVNEHYRLKERD